MKHPPPPPPPPLPPDTAGPTVVKVHALEEASATPSLSCTALVSVAV